MGVELIRIRKSVRVEVLIAVHNPVLIRILDQWIDPQNGYLIAVVQAVFVRIRQLRIGFVDAEFIEV